MIDYSTRKLKRHYFASLKTLWLLQSTKENPHKIDRHKEYVSAVKKELQRRGVWVP